MLRQAQHEDNSRAFALRLGLRQVKGLKEAAGRAIVAARDGRYASVGELWRRAGVTTAALTTLADADAFGSLGLDRRGALWAIRALGHNGRETAEGLPLFAAATPTTDDEAAVSLPLESDGEAVANDYTALRLSLKHHPLALLREGMDGFGIARNETLVECANGAAVTVAGLVLVRQRPSSANGVIFVTLEDETGVANVIVWPDAFARFRKVVLSARLLRIDGALQREGIVTHVIAKRIVDMSDHLDALGTGEAVGPTQALSKRRLAPANPRRHPRNNHIHIASRDFH